ncbi:hypothetical protein EIK77_005426 [Talaromyces pinophilus]|nr:hypothetical protein EIK77_005426 [Talaromyces pinophilus]
MIPWLENDTMPSFLYRGTYSYKGHSIVLHTPNFTSFNIIMAALCTEAELEQLLQEVDEIPSAQELYSLNFDPTWGTMDPLDPNFPILEEDSLLHPVRQTLPELTPPSSVISEDHGLPFEETLDKIKELEAQ